MKKKQKHIKPKPCKKCGRILTDQKSLRIGMGPTCAMKGGPKRYEILEKNGQLKLFD